MADLRGTRSPPGARPTVTAEASRRIVIRTPYCRGMRARLARCGGTPRWDPDHGVWTMPWATLGAVVAAVVSTFGAALVRIEVADVGGQAPARAEHLLGDAGDEASARTAGQDGPVRRLRSVDRPGYVWLSYELTAEVPAIAYSPC